MGRSRHPASRDISASLHVKNIVLGYNVANMDTEAAL
jgi:hypothetical protein